MFVVNEHVWGCICGHCKYGSGVISSAHHYGNWSSLSVTSITHSKIICFRSGKSEAGGRFEVYHINHLKESIGHAMLCSRFIFIHVMFLK